MAPIHNLDILTYSHSNTVDHTLNDIPTLCPLDNGQPPPAPTHGLGTPEQLPLELLQIILVSLDLKPLTDFRRVNRQARQVVDSIPQYNQIIQHAPISIRAILSIESGDWISCQTLYQKLCTDACDICGHFGGYLYLITCRRVCFLCFNVRSTYRPLLKVSAAREFGLRKEDFANLPQMRCLPGVYSPLGATYRRRFTFVDHDAARQAGITLHGSVEEMDRYAKQLEAERLQKYPEPGLLRDSQRIRRNRPRDGFNGFSVNAQRFLGVIRAPVIDARQGSTEWGVYCEGCKNHYDNKPLHWRRLYTRERFQRHIEEYGDIVDGKHERLEY